MNLLDAPINPLEVNDSELDEIRHDRIIEENDIEQCFDHYKKEVKSAATKIYESGNAHEYLTHYLKSNHIGDDEELEILLIDTFTPFVENSQINHMDIVGTAESGKSKLANTVSKIIPERYIERIKTNSPKYVFYKQDWNDDLNYIIFQDAVDSDNINLLKTITDPENEGDITHKTVIDKKPVELTIPGKVMAMITHAKDFVDVELNTRLRRINPDESTKHNCEVKEALKNGFGQSNEDSFYNQVAKAVFELISQNPVKVFNPHIILLNVENMGKRDVKMFRNSVHALTFLNQKQRHKTKSGVLLGTYEDYLKVKRLWGKYQYHQQYKLTTKQLDLLTILNTIPEGEDVSQMSNDEGCTYQELAKIVGRSPATIKVWINGKSNEESQSEKLGLKTLGLVDVKYSNEDSNGRALIYRTLEGKEVAESLAVTPLPTVTKLKVTAKDAPFPKITNIIYIIYGFIIGVTGKKVEEKIIKKTLEEYDLLDCALSNDTEIYYFIDRIESKGIIEKLTNHNDFSSIEKFFHKTNVGNAPHNLDSNKDSDDFKGGNNDDLPLPKKTIHGVTEGNGVTLEENFLNDEDETHGYEIIDMTKFD
jgi:DNA-binding MarR family transcriptional regulator